MGQRKVEIPVDFDVKELLKAGKGEMTWDEYLLDLKREADKVINTSKRFGR
jgi:hypothetical protein